MSVRLDRITALHGRQLVMAAMAESRQIPPEIPRVAQPATAGDPGRPAPGRLIPDVTALVAWFAEADPTPQHRYTQWLVLTYIHGGFRLEDLGKARETLELWHRSRHLLPVTKRDISGCSTLAAAWKLVEPFTDKISANAEDRAERAAARAESLILHEGENGFTVAVPLTERASNWWGRGTRWCTAATKGTNQFQTYNRTGPLVVAVMPDGAKFQMAVETGFGFSFMDHADEEVTRETIAKHWAELGPLLRWSLTKSTYQMNLLPEGAIGNEELLSLLRANPPHYASDIGDALPTAIWPLMSEDDCLRIIHPQNFLIKHIPVEQLTDKLIRTGIVQQCPPDKFPEWWWKQPDAVELVIKNVPKTLKNVPREHLTTQHLELVCEHAPETLESLYTAFGAVSHLNWKRLRILAASKGLSLHHLDNPHSPDRIEEATLAGYRAGIWPPFSAFFGVPRTVGLARLAAALQGPKRGRVWLTSFNGRHEHTIERFVPEDVLTQDIVDECCLHCHPMAIHVSEQWVSPVVRAVVVNEWMSTSARFETQMVGFNALHFEHMPKGTASRNSAILQNHALAPDAWHVVLDHIAFLSELDDDALDAIIRMLPRIVLVLPAERRTAERIGVLADSVDLDPGVRGFLAGHDGMLERLAAAQLTIDHGHGRPFDSLSCQEKAQTISANVMADGELLRLLPAQYWSPELMMEIGVDWHADLIPDWAKEKWPETMASIAIATEGLPDRSEEFEREPDEEEVGEKGWNEGFLDGLRVLLDERSARLNRPDQSSEFGTTFGSSVACGARP